MVNGRWLKLWLHFSPKLRDDLWSVSKLDLYLRTLCARIKMTPLRDPVICKVEDGVTGVLIIEESHIAAHTCPTTCKIRVCLDSCRDFSPSKVAAWSTAYWCATAEIEATGEYEHPLLLERELP
jgi:S-adenosylmethionine/arginine decarboxylase-like enzyme